MTSRKTLTSAELQKIYSAEPFSYDFEKILSWDTPCTLPIVPPNIASLSTEALRTNAARIAINLIKEIEATRPSDTPGLETYLAKNYSNIKKLHPDQINHNYAKKKFLLFLYNKINKKTSHPLNRYMAVDLYASSINDIGLNVEVTANELAEDGHNFYWLEEELYYLMSAATAAQIEIVLRCCLEKVRNEFKEFHPKAIRTLRENNLKDNNKSITLNLNSTIQLSSTLTTLSTTENLQSALFDGIQRLKWPGLTATPIFRLGIGVFFYSAELGNADLYHESALSIPAELLIPELPDNIHDISLKHGSFESPFRIHATLDTYTLTDKGNATHAEKEIPVRPLIMDEESNSYTWVPSSDFPIRLSFPIHTESGSSTTTPIIPMPSDPYEGVNLRKAWSEATPLPAHEPPNYKDCIYCFPPESGLPPLYVVFNSPYPGATTIGTYSGRPYNPDKAGGPIERMDWRKARITAGGVELVKLHTSRFPPSDANKIMIDRLEKILQSKLQATDIDKRFFTHEIRELERFRALGIADKILPTDGGETWNNTHAATLEDYQLGSDAELLYTAEALEADAIQLERENP
ncbi:S-type pyocin domain-containing protein [Pseudomonas putida group bacterium ESBL64]|uniref:S-type pyocin domain-containing protein n=1 Tax=Pseudomonas putida group bacterium ESBL64 TaxID=3122582 RepID=UPI0030E20200